MLISQMLKEFHEAFALDASDSPRLPSKELAELRLALMDEEYTELCEAVEQDDLVEIADALADIVYIAFGTALVYGIPLDEILDEVHRSNMAKLDENGKPLYHPNGKVRKPESWTAPDIKKILDTRNGK